MAMTVGREKDSASRSASAGASGVRAGAPASPAIDETRWLNVATPRSASVRLRIVCSGPVAGTGGRSGMQGESTISGTPSRRLRGGVEPGIQPLGGVPGHQPGLRYALPHVGEAEGDGLVVQERPVELLALLRVRVRTD